MEENIRYMIHKHQHDCVSLHEMCWKLSRKSFSSLITSSLPVNFSFAKKHLFECWFSVRSDRRHGVRERRKLLFCLPNRRLLFADGSWSHNVENNKYFRAGFVLHNVVINNRNEDRSVIYLLNSDASHRIEPDSDCFRHQWQQSENRSNVQKIYKMMENHY